MKSVIQPLLLTTILGLVGCSGNEALNTSQSVDLSAQVNADTASINTSPSDTGLFGNESVSSVQTIGADHPLSLKLAKSEILLTEQTTMELDYKVEAASQEDISLNVISYDEEVINASVKNDKIVIQANSVNSTTSVNLDVVVTNGADNLLVTLPVEVSPQIQFELDVAQTEVDIDHLDTFYIPLSVIYDGSELVNLSIENLEGEEFATVDFETQESFSNNLIIQGKGVYETGTLSFNVVASTVDGEVSVSVSVAVYPEVNIDIRLSNESPKFKKTETSFTIVRVCTDVSDDYEIEITEISGNGSVTATIEGSVISISSDDIDEDTNASFMVTASLLGVSEVAYFDVFVTAG